MLPTRLLLEPAAKGSTPFPARLPPSLPLPPERHRHRARPSQLRAPETRKPPPSTLLLAPEDRRGAGRATSEGDGNCRRAKMSPGVLVERGSEGEAPRSLPSRSPPSTKEPLQQSAGHPPLRTRMNTPHTFVGTHAPSHTFTHLRAEHAPLHHSFFPELWAAIVEFPGGPEQSGDQVLCAAGQIVSSPSPLLTPPFPNSSLPSPPLRSLPPPFHSLSFMFLFLNDGNKLFSFIKGKKKKAWQI